MPLKGSKLGLGAVVLAVAGTAILGFATPATDLPTVTVYHDPT